MKSILRRLGVAAGVILLSACSTSFVATRVDPAGLGKDLTAEPGIYYTLPKTVIDVSFPVEFTQYTGGELEKVPGCRLNAELGNAMNCPVESKKPGMTFRVATIVGSPIADYEHVYRVTPDSSIFKTLQFEFAYDDLGNLAKADGKGQNEALKIVTKVAGAVVNYASSGASVKAAALGDVAAAEGQSAKLLFKSQLHKEGPRRPAQEKTKAPPARDCGQLPGAQASADWITRVVHTGHVLDGLLTTAKFKHLTPPEVLCLTDLVSPLAVKLPADSLLADKIEDFGAMETPGVVALWLAQKAKERDEKQALLKAARVTLHIDASETEVAVHTIRLARPLIPAALPKPEEKTDKNGNPIKPEPEPKQPGGIANHDELCEHEFMGDVLPGRLRKEPGWCVLKNAVLVAQAPGTAGVDSADEALQEVKKEARYLIRVVPPDSAAGSSFPKAVSPPALQADGGGYRYRIPATGRVELVRLAGPPFPCPDAKDGQKCHPSPPAYPCLKPEEAKLCKATLLGEKSLTVAQLGLIAALPATFNGSDAQLGFSLSDTGALKNIKLGQTAQTGSEIAGLIDTVRDARAQRAQAQAAVDAAAAEAPAKARKSAIQKKKDEACLRALDDPALVAGTLPAVCE